MIKVFAPTDKTFSTNGDAVIIPTRAAVFNTDNGAFYLEIETTTDYIDYIKPNNIIVANTPKGEQAFRIASPVDVSRTKIKARCNHIFYDSSNYLIADSYAVDKTCLDALDHINNATDTASPFTMLSDITSRYSYRCVRKSLNEAVNDIIERWGGHLVRDNYNIAVYNEIGTDNGVTIQYGKNLKDITVSYNWDSVCTKLLPVGKDGFTLDNLYVYAQTQYDIPYTKTITFNQDINAEDYETEEQYKAALRDDLTAQAEKYLLTAQYPAVTYTLSANLEKITDIGDYIRVYDERLAVDILTQVISYTYDCITERYTQIEFGNTKASLPDLLKTVSNSVNASINENNNIVNVAFNNAIAESESKILGVLGDSYVIYEGNQILVVDALPKETAHNVIRINSEGIGFSQNGVSGNFSSAWEINGTLNMQNINVIGLVADMIKGGTLKLGSNLNESGILELYNEDNMLIAQMNKDGLKMFNNDGSYILMNAQVGFAGYDASDTKIFWVDGEEFHQKKSIIEEEITLCNKVRFIPIEIRDGNNNLVNDGIGLVNVY